MKRPALSRRAGAALLSLVLAAPAAGQSTDRGTLVIHAGTRDVGSESFGVIPDSTGVQFTARTVFGTRPATELTATLDRHRDGQLSFQLERRAGTGSSKLYAVQKRNRITVRRVDRGAEQASELSGGPNVVLLADSVFSLYLQIAALATEDGRPVAAIFPQGTRRLSLTAQRSAERNGTVVRFRGELEGEIHLGHQGELLRILLPALGLEAVRKPD